ncbi:hypothetical protein GCM10025794_34420 [Massilia kyonggiensis]|jgi:hypothetical protein
MADDDADRLVLASVLIGWVSRKALDAKYKSPFFAMPFSVIDHQPVDQQMRPVD